MIGNLSTTVQGTLRKNIGYGRTERKIHSTDLLTPRSPNRALPLHTEAVHAPPGGLLGSFMSLTQQLEQAELSTR